MKHPRLSAATVLMIILLLMTTGCWNKKELPEFGFVQALAIDLDEEGQLLLTTLFYKPGGAMPSGDDSERKPSSQFVVHTKGRTLFEAVRDISINLGRIAQWSHMRILLISEKTARSDQMSGLLDFFLRDHEPRETLRLAVVADGEAGNILNVKPHIENTIGQQLREMETRTHNISGKTRDADLLHTAIQFRSESGIALLPFVHYRSKPQKELSIAGLAVFKNRRLAARLPGPRTEYLLMLRNEFKMGILEIPCKDNPKQYNALEKVKTKTVKTVGIDGDSASVRLNVRIEGSYGELRCLNITTPEVEAKEIDYISQILKAEYERIIEYMKREKLDLLGIGDEVYRRYPSVWFKWKEDWPDRLARVQFDISVDLKIANSGMTMPRAY